MKRPGCLWTYGKGEWQGPLIYRGGDEYGRWTLVLRMPGERAIVWAYKTCRDEHCSACSLGHCPVTGKLHNYISGGYVICDDCHCVTRAPKAFLEWAS